jgi:hypothetical protein
MAERKVVPFDEFYYQLKLMHLFQKHPVYRGHYENLEYITKEGEIIKNLNKGEFYKYLGINQIIFNTQL